MRVLQAEKKGLKAESDSDIEQPGTDTERGFSRLLVVLVGVIGVLFTISGLTARKIKHLTYRPLQCSLGFALCLRQAFWCQNMEAKFVSVLIRMHVVLTVQRSILAGIRCLRETARLGITHTVTPGHQHIPKA